MNEESSKEKGNRYVMKVTVSHFQSFVFCEGGQKLFNFGMQENLIVQGLSIQTHAHTKHIFSKFLLGIILRTFILTDGIKMWLIGRTD